MPYHKRIAGIGVLLGLAMTSITRADDGLRLSTVAAENGYAYSSLMTEAGATLTRPGVRIVIRAGRIFYEVNDATPVADAVPRYDGKDIVVSSKLAEHLRVLALKYPYPAPVPPAAVPPPDGSNAYTIAAHQIPGRQILAVSGNGPANTPVLFTLTAQLSSDLPDTTLLRYVLMTDARGSFSTQASYGQSTHAGTFLKLSAAAADGSATAVTHFTIGSPNEQLRKSALDAWPAK